MGWKMEQWPVGWQAHAPTHFNDCKLFLQTTCTCNVSCKVYQHEILGQLEEEQVSQPFRTSCGRFSRSKSVRGNIRMMIVYLSAKCRFASPSELAKIFSSAPRKSNTLQLIYWTLVSQCEAVFILTRVARDWCIYASAIRP